MQPQQVYGKPEPPPAPGVADFGINFYDVGYGFLVLLANVSAFLAFTVRQDMIFPSSLTRSRCHRRTRRPPARITRLPLSRRSVRLRADPPSAGR